MSGFNNEIKNWKEIRNERYQKMLKKVFGPYESQVQGNIFEANHRQMQPSIFKRNEETPILINTGDDELFYCEICYPTVQSQASDVCSSVLNSRVYQPYSGLLPDVETRRFKEMEKYKSKIDVTLQGSNDTPFLKFKFWLFENSLQAIDQKNPLLFKNSAVLDIIGRRFPEDNGCKVSMKTGLSAQPLCCSSLNNLCAQDNLHVMNAGDGMHGGTIVENNQEMILDNMCNKNLSLLPLLSVEKSPYNKGRDCSEQIYDHLTQSRAVNNGQGDSNPLKNIRRYKKKKDLKSVKHKSCRDNLGKENVSKGKAGFYRELILVDSDDEMYNRKPVCKQIKHNNKKISMTKKTDTSMKIEQNKPTTLILKKTKFKHDNVSGSPVSKKIKGVDTSERYGCIDMCSDDDDLFMISKSKKLSFPMTCNSGHSVSSVDKKNHPCENLAPLLSQTNISEVRISREEYPTIRDQVVEGVESMI